MAVAISISRASEDIWTLSNARFALFADLLRARCGEDRQLRHVIDLGELFHGYALDLIHAENAAISLRLRELFRECAQACLATDSLADARHFEQLIALLDRFPVAT